MIQWIRNPVAITAVLGVGLLLVVAGCSNRPPEPSPQLDAISKTVGFALPADAEILAYVHRHGEGDAPCSNLWIIRASTPLTGPDNQLNPTRVTSPFKSLRLLVEQATQGRTVIEPADAAACECIDWDDNETACRLRQANTRDGWVAALEAIKPK